MSAHRYLGPIFGLLLLLATTAGVHGQAKKATDKTDKKAAKKQPAGVGGIDLGEAGSQLTPAAEKAAKDRPPADGEDRRLSRQTLAASLTIFVLAVFVGFEVITKVPPTLHTPLMSGSNAISGITLVGALLVAGAGFHFSGFLGFAAVVLATINVVGGFLVTHRMLAMFKKR